MTEFPDRRYWRETTTYGLIGGRWTGKTPDEVIQLLEDRLAEVHRECNAARDLGREQDSALRELVDYFEAQGFTEATKVLARARVALARYEREVGE